jgi:hypothetical protein
MARSLATLVLVTACGSAPQTPDAQIDGYAPPGCTTVMPHDDFSHARPCDPWGSPLGKATIESGSGVLAVTLNQGVNGFAGCVADAVPFTDAGVFIHTLHDQPVQDAHAWFSAAGLTMVETDDGYISLRTADGHQIGYTKNEARWWRIRPDRGTIAADTSPDAITWTTVSRYDTSPPATVTVALGAEYERAPDVQHVSPLTVDLQNFNLCP